MEVSPEQKPSPETIIESVKNKLLVLLKTVKEGLYNVVEKMEINEKAIREAKQKHEEAMAAQKKAAINGGGPQSPQATKHGMGDH